MPCDDPGVVNRSNAPVHRGFRPDWAGLRQYSLTQCTPCLHPRPTWRRRRRAVRGRVAWGSGVGREPGAITRPKDSGWRRSTSPRLPPAACRLPVPGPASREAATGGTSPLGGLAPGGLCKAPVGRCRPHPPLPSRSRDPRILRGRATRGTPAAVRPADPPWPPDRWGHGGIAPTAPAQDRNQVVRPVLAPRPAHPADRPHVPTSRPAPEAG